VLEANRQTIMAETLAGDFTAYELADALLAPKGEGDFTASFAIGKVM
jgi:hypothetical protein